MKKIKIIWGDGVKKIKKWGFVRMLNYKNEIKALNTIIDKKEKDIQGLNDKLCITKLKLDDFEKTKQELEKARIKITTQEQIIEASDKALKQKLVDIKKLDELNNELLTKAFNIEQELKSKIIQIQEYELEIKDLKSDRYLVKKIPAGRTKNTIKTKISKPMSANVTKYMRGEHE